MSSIAYDNALAARNAARKSETEAFDVYLQHSHPRDPERIAARAAYRDANAARRVDEAALQAALLREGPWIG